MVVLRAWEIEYIYDRFIVRFPIGLDFLFITLTFECVCPS